MEKLHRTVLVAHPSPDLYGSDLQMLETVSGFISDRWRVVVAVPEEGPLLPLLSERGADILVLPSPVLRKSLLHPTQILGFTRNTFLAAVGSRRLLRRIKADAVWVNTLTIPTWLAAARLLGVPCAVHVHEAEKEGSRAVRAALVSQIMLANVAVVNSGAAARAITDVIPALNGKLSLVYNGVPGPDAVPLAPSFTSKPTRIALVGRLSPRKGTDVALEAVSQLRAEGYDIHLDLYGTVFPGYEWFEEELRDRVAQNDLMGAVTFHGYVRPVWDSLAAADIVIVPSRVEPFGNVAVEAQLAGRPVVVSSIQGLTEIVTDGVNGLHAEAGNSKDLADCIRRLLDYPDLARDIARAGHRNATDRFTVERYRKEIASVLDSLYSDK